MLLVKVGTVGVDIVVVNHNKRASCHNDTCRQGAYRLHGLLYWVVAVVGQVAQVAQW